MIGKPKLLKRTTLNVISFDSYMYSFISMFLFEMLTPIAYYLKNRNENIF